MTTGAELIREFIELALDEVIRKQGGKYVLMTKHKGKNGKRRKLGTHASKASAEAQERAIHAAKH